LESLGGADPSTRRRTSKGEGKKKKPVGTHDSANRGLPRTGAVGGEKPGRNGERGTQKRKTVKRS